MKDCHSVDTQTLRPTEIKVCLKSHLRLVAEPELKCASLFLPPLFAVVAVGEHTGLRHVPYSAGS